MTIQASMQNSRYSAGNETVYLSCVLVPEVTDYTLYYTLNGSRPWYGFDYFNPEWLNKDSGSYKSGLMSYDQGKGVTVFPVHLKNAAGGTQTPPYQTLFFGTETPQLENFMVRPFDGESIAVILNACAVDYRILWSEDKEETWNEWQTGAKLRTETAENGVFVLLMHAKLQHRTDPSFESETQFFVYVIKPKKESSGEV